MEATAKNTARGGSFEGRETRDDLVEFGIYGALRACEGTLVLGQDCNGFLKPRESMSECYRPWGGGNESTS